MPLYVALDFLPPLSVVWVIKAQRRFWTVLMIRCKSWGSPSDCSNGYRATKTDTIGLL